MKNTRKDDAEYYFIQLIFCKNRNLLRQSYRELYDIMFSKYKGIYTEGVERKIDVMDINNKFLRLLQGEK